MSQPTLRVALSEHIPFAAFATVGATLAYCMSPSLAGAMGVYSVATIVNNTAATLLVGKEASTLCKVAKILLPGPFSVAAATCAFLSSQDSLPTITVDDVITVTTLTAISIAATFLHVGP